MPHLWSKIRSHSIYAVFASLLATQSYWAKETVVAAFANDPMKSYLLLSMNHIYCCQYLLMSMKGQQ